MKQTNLLYIFHVRERSENFLRQLSIVGCTVLWVSDLIPAIATQQPHVWYRHIPAYTKCEVQLIKLLLMMD